MSVVFLSEMSFDGKIQANHPNMRTEFAWMHALDADHKCIRQYQDVRNYDHVFIIFPKGRVYLSAEGSRLVEAVNPVSDILASDFIDVLKQSNKKVYYIQEGPHWWFNDYELIDQIHFYNMLANCDGIFVHNESDIAYYKGLLPYKHIQVIPTLMIESSITDIIPTKEEKVIIGGNFARWYGGFESYIVAQTFQVPIWGQTSHAMRQGEDQLINILPRVFWIDWMKQLSAFKYAVHLMPTVAAGTFSLNCAYFGIPCIGNIKVDTQRLCHPLLSVDIDDIDKATTLAKKLSTDKEFYTMCSDMAKTNYNAQYNLNIFLQKMKNI